MEPRLELSATPGDRTVGESKPWSGWRWLINRVASKRRSVFLLLLLNLLVYLVGIAFPVLTQKAVDAITSSPDPTVPIFLLVAALLALAGEYGLSIWRQRYLIEIGTFVDRQLANNFYLSVLTQRHDQKSGENTNITNTFQQLRPIRNFILSFVPRIVFEVGGALASLVVIAVYSLPIAVAVLLVTGFFAMAMRNQVTAIGNVSREQFRIDGERQRILTETYPALGTVKALVIEGRLFRQWRNITTQYTSVVESVYWVSNRFTNASLLSSRATSLAIIAVGCIQISFQTLTLGELLAIQLLALRATAPVFSFGDMMRQWKDVQVAMQAFSEYIARERERPAITGGISAIPHPGVAFQDVTFSYRGKSEPALIGISFVMPREGLVAIVGRNGAGKSTLVRILMALERRYTGCVTVGGEDVRNYRPRMLRDRIRLLQQDTVLFTGSVRSNLDIGLSPIDEASMWEALDFADASELVRSLPQGLDTPITEHPRNLSGGQRQRIAVARAFVGDPEIVVLDEPTAFLDAEAALALEQKIASVSKHKLIICVSHNLSALQEAAMIIVLEQGRVVGTGVHQELLNDCSIYRQLWDDHSCQKGELPPGAIPF